MFYREVDDDIRLSLTVPSYAEELFGLIDANRGFLRQWLPWLDTIKEPADTRVFIEEQLLRFQRGEALHVTIFYRQRMAGVLGYNRIDRINGIGMIGYWLARQYNGRGVMLKSVRDIIEVGWNSYQLNRIDIRCAPENNRSRAIPEALGFTNEGIIRQAENHYGRYVDHVVYGLLRGEDSSRPR